MKYKNIENLEEFKKDYEDLTIKELVEKYSLNEKTIWSYVKKLGAARKQGSKRINKVNDDYFSIRNDCANKYYILGLIYSDGNLPVKNKNSFIISNTDKNLLEDIKKELQFTGIVITEFHKKFKKYIYKLQITSEQIRKDLEFIGLTPDKTFTVKFPNVPKEYIRDFIRGLWDGEGCVNFSKSRPNTNLLCSSFVSANLEFISKVLEFLPTKKKNIKKIVKKSVLYSISFRGFDSLRIKDFLYYKNCLCMKRKKDKFFAYKPRRSETIIHNPNGIKE